MITIKEETIAALGRVREGFDRVHGRVTLCGSAGWRYGFEGWELIEEPVDPPWIKDYDGVVNRRLGGCDGTTTNWRMIVGVFERDESSGRRNCGPRFAGVGFSGGPGGSCGVVGYPRYNPSTGGRAWVSGLCCLSTWCGYAKRVGCVELKIETQDVNVKACDFYAKQGVSAGERYSGCVSRVGRMRWSSTGC